MSKNASHMQDKQANDLRLEQIQREMVDEARRVNYNKLDEGKLIRSILHWQQTHLDD